MNKQKGRILCLDFLLVAVLVGFDQFTKYLAAARLKGNPAFPIIDGVLELQYLENRGSAFGMLQGQRWFLFVTGTLFITVLTFLLFRIPVQKKFRLLHILIAGIISGGLGNLIDRFRFGYVVDFIYFVLIDYPIFNVADSYVVVSAIALFFLILFVYRDEDLEQLIGLHKKRDGRAEQQNKAEEQIDRRDKAEKNRTAE